MNTLPKSTYENLRGKRYIAYARCASADGAKAKLQEQVRRIRQFCDSLDMQCVDEVRLGVAFQVEREQFAHPPGEYGFAHRRIYRLDANGSGRSASGYSREASMKRPAERGHPSGG